MGIKNINVREKSSKDIICCVPDISEAKISEKNRYATKEARVKEAPPEAERKKIAIGNPPTPVEPLTKPEKLPTQRVQDFPKLELNLNCLSKRMHEKKTRIEIVKRIIS